MHKSELGAVKAEPHHERRSRIGVHRQETTTTGGLDGILAQPQVRGTRELVAGTVRDPRFGPCVMFGLGGIYTEVLDDVSFRIALLEQSYALAMIEGIRRSAILRPLCPGFWSP